MCQVGWDIGPGSRRTFLSLVFKSTPQKSRVHHLWVGRTVCDHKILSSGLTHYARVGTVLRYMRTNGLPHFVEYAGGTCKMNTCKIAVCKAYLANGGTVHVNKIDDTIGKTGFLQYPHEHLGRIDLRIGRLPYNHITTH